MSISGSLSNALSGLSAASRAAEVVSSNLANSMTEGYGRRSLELSSASGTSTGGVRLDGIQRHIDPNTLADRRQADASYAGSDRLLSFAIGMEQLAGLPNDAGSLAGMIATFEASLASAANMPESQERLQLVSNNASNLAQGFNRISDGIQKSRMEADRNIDAMVSALNSNLSRVEGLNQEISSARVAGHETAALFDQRQSLIDEISKVVPVRLMPRDNDTVALYTHQGVALLDGSAATIEFTAANQITPYQSIEDDTLSGLFINGTQVRTGSENGAIGEGLLAAEFAIRDELSVKAQQNIDGLAEDMIGRFQDTGVDPTLAAGLPGLFTDRGAAFSGPDNTGLADRISLNAVVDMAQDAEVWRLRDGLGALTSGPVSESGLLQGLSDVMSAKMTLSSGNLSGQAGSAHEFATRLSSLNGGQRLSREQEVSFASTKLNILKDAELSDGVDSDAELQRLLLIEQSYAANARVIQTIDELMDTLLRL